MNQSQSSDEAIAARLRSPDLRQRIDTLVLLRREPQKNLADSVLDALIENLSSPNKAVQRHCASAIAAAGRSNPTIVPRLLAMLEGPQTSGRWAAAYALGLIDDALDLRACQPLMETMASSDGDLRWAALELIVRLGRRFPSHIRAALLALQEGDNANGRKMAIYAMRYLGIRDAAALAAASRACAAKDSQVRLAALSFFKEAGAADGPAIEVVLACLQNDPDKGVRRAAAYTLGYLGHRSERVMATLREAAGAANDASLRKAASLTLARLGEQP